MTIAEVTAALNATPATARNNTQVAHNAALLRHSLNAAQKIGYQPNESAPAYILLELEWLQNAIGAAA